MAGARNNNEKRGYEHAIDELINGEAKFRKSLGAIQQVLNSASSNKNVQNNSELKDLVDKLIALAAEVLKQPDFENLIGKNEKDYTFDVKAFDGYLAKFTPLMDGFAILTGNESCKAIIEVIPGVVTNEMKKEFSVTTPMDLLIMPVQRGPRYQLLTKAILDQIDSNNNKRPDEKVSMEGIGDALKSATAVSVFANESKRQREFIEGELKQLSTYNDRRLGAGHQKEKAELAEFISAMKVDPAVGIGAFQLSLMQKLQQQLAEINDNKKPGQKQGKYTQLLAGMISDLSKDPALVGELIKSADGKLDPAFVKESWANFVNGDFSKTFADKIMPTLSDAQLFNFAQTLMTAHLTSDNKSDSMLRANGHLSGMLYKEMAKRSGYDPLANPDKPAPDHMNVLNNLVYKNIDSIQRAKADQVKAKAGAGMQVGSAEDYAKSVKNSAATAILFAFDPTEAYLKNGDSDPQKITEFKQHFQSVSKDEKSVNAILNENVTSDAVPSLPENYFATGEPVIAETMSAVSDVESEATYDDTESSLSGDESFVAEGEELEGEFDVDDPSADEIVSALNKQKESDDPKAFLEDGTDDPVAEEDDDLDLGALNDALRKHREAEIINDFLKDFKGPAEPGPAAVIPEPVAPPMEPPPTISTPGVASAFDEPKPAPAAVKPNEVKPPPLQVPADFDAVMKRAEAEKQTQEAAKQAAQAKEGEPAKREMEALSRMDIAKRYANIQQKFGGSASVAKADFSSSVAKSAYETAAPDDLAQANHYIKKAEKEEDPDKKAAYLEKAEKSLETAGDRLQKFAEKNGVNTTVTKTINAIEKLKDKIQDQRPEPNSPRLK